MGESLSIEQVIFKSSIVDGIGLDEALSNNSVTSAPADHMERHWHQSEPIQAVNAGDVYSPKIAIDAKGNAMAVWSQRDGDCFSIWANLYTATVGWSAATMISADRTSDAFQPNLTMSASGIALIVWEQRDNHRCSIWVNRFVPGVGWGVASLLKAVTSPAFLSPILGIDSKGNGLIASTLHGRYTSEIWGESYSLGNLKTGVPSKVRISHRISHFGNASSPKIAVNANGRAVVVWIQHDGRFHQVWASRYVSSLGWDQPTRIDAPVQGNACDPQVSIDGDGNVIVLWQNDVAGRAEIWTNYYTTQTWVWGNAHRISGQDGHARYSPRVVMDEFGSAIAIWTKDEGAYCRVWARIYSPHNGWQVERPIEAPMQGESCDPQISIDPAGLAMVIWRKCEGAYAGVWVCRYMPSSGWDKAEYIVSDKRSKVCGAKIAISSWGEAVAIWLSVGKTHTSVQASVFG